MTLFFSLLPIYIFGNLHCVGMCGPVAFLLAQSRYRWFYILGRICSFSLAGLFSAEMGFLFASILKRFDIASFFSIFLGIMIILMAFLTFFRLRFPAQNFFARAASRLTPYFSKLLRYDGRKSLFFFGFSTIFLPCGQTLLVFSAVALEGSAAAGLANGFIFALFTTPALLFAMHAKTFLSKIKSSYHLWMGVAMLLVGTLFCLRGLAEFSLVPHFILNPEASSRYHIALF